MPNSNAIRFAHLAWTHTARSQQAACRLLLNLSFRVQRNHPQARYRPIHHTESPSPKTLWRPSETNIQDANITRFATFFRDEFLPLLGTDYEALHAASVSHPGAFWKAIWEFCEVGGELGDTAFLPGTTLFNGSWFPDAKLNFAEELLHPEKLSDPIFAESLAIVAIAEQEQRIALTRKQLFDYVCRVASFLKSQGVRQGDRVVAVMPNNAEAVIGLLATAAVGAIWSSCSPEFGEDAICDRFGQIEPKVMLTAAECLYNGKTIRPLSKVNQILHRLPWIKTLLVVGKPNQDVANTDRDAIMPTVQEFQWSDVCQQPVDAMAFERFPFAHPLCIVYSSGTTGVPKCIVHGAGGTLLQHKKEHILHCDLKANDTLFYYTTTGWMMWNWLVSGLASQAVIVLFDGSPFASGSKTLWEIAETERITHFGASPRFYTTLEKDSYKPVEHLDLSSLRCVLSTGSPLLPETFDWIYEAISSTICLASISGGTDLLSCFVLGNPTLSVVRGHIQCKGLGMDVRVFNEQGDSILDEPGELVCSSAFPSMPIGFWNDPGHIKYSAAYFERFADVWCHGDWAQQSKDGGFQIFGRSDATLNPSGVRIGTAEIYQQVEVFPEIAECLATVFRSDGDEQIVLFLKMQSGQPLTHELKSAIRQRLKERCSPRHVPRFMAEAPDLPRTISGKLSEIAVRSAISGKNLGNAGALANPECLIYFSNWKAE